MVSTHKEALTSLAPSDDEATVTEYNHLEASDELGEVSERPPKARAGRIQLARGKKQRALEAAKTFLVDFALAPHPEKLPEKGALANPSKWSVATLRKPAQVCGLTFAKKEKSYALRRLIKSYRCGPPFL